MDGDARIGTIVDGRYRIERKLGDGGVGIVYAGEHLSLRKPVAIKFLREQYAFHRAMRPRFEREARALAQLRHPNVVEVTDYGVIGDVPYLVMELLEGRTLDQLIDEGPLDPPKAVSLMREVLRGLAFAHAQGIVHRDLKPANVFVQRVGPDDHIKILDFGFVKFVEEREEKKVADTPLTRSGIAFGTPAYMSPEQATGAPTDATTDVYSAGVLFFELLTGTQPYKGELPDIVRQHLAAPVPALASARPDLVASPELQSVVRRAMAKEPRDRFADAVAYLKAVESLPRNAASLRGSQKSLPFDPTQPASIRPGELETAKIRTAQQPKKSAARWFVPLLLAALCAGGYFAWTQGWFTSGGAANPIGTDPPETEPPIVPEPTPMVEPPLAREIDAGGAPATIDAGFDAGFDGGFDGGFDAGFDAGHDAGAVDAGPAHTTETPPAATRARDPFAGEDMPRVIRSFHERVSRGDTIGEAGIRVLQRYGRENREDPRHHLLLAHIFVNRRWLSDAVERYELAYQADPTCRGAQWMLPDLIELAKTDQYGERAANLIVTAYGAEARDEVEREIGRRGVDRRAAANLRRLLDRL
jgi:serine/threonine-protein kinase